MSIIALSGSRFCSIRPHKFMPQDWFMTGGMWCGSDCQCWDQVECWWQICVRKLSWTNLGLQESATEIAAGAAGDMLPEDRPLVFLCCSKRTSAMVETRVVQAPPPLPERHEVTGFAEDCWTPSLCALLMDCCWFMCQESKKPSPPEEKIWADIGEKWWELHAFIELLWAIRVPNRVILQNSTWVFPKIMVPPNHQF